MLNLSLKAGFVRLIEKIQSYVKTDMIYLIKGGFWSLSSQIVSSVAAFFVVFTLAKILPKEVLGQYRFILSIISLLLIFTIPGIGTTLIRSVARGHNIDLSEIVKEKIRWGLVGSAVAIIVGIYYFFKGNINLSSAMLFSAMFLPFIASFAIYSSYYKGKENFKISALFESISGIFQATIIILAAFLSENVLIILFAYLIGQVFFSYFFYRKTLKYIQKKQQFDISPVGEDSDAVQYGKKLSYVSVLNTVTNNMDVLLIGHYMGPYPIAIYYIALSIPKNIVMIFNSIVRVALPKFSKKIWDNHDRKSTLRKLGIMFVLLFIPAFIYYIFVPLFIRIFFSAYGDSINIAKILSLLIVVSPLNAVVGQILQARKLVKKTVILEIISFTVFVLSFILTYHSFGLLGAAVGLVLSETIVFAVGLLLIR